MQILFIQPPNTIGSYLNLPGKEIPLSFCYIAAYLKNNDFDKVRILDLDFLGSISPHLENELKQFPPDIVGITSYTNNVGIAGEVAAQVKQQYPEAVVVLGGFHASALPEQTLQEFPDFDGVVVGEGELSFTSLAGRVQSGQSPAGLPGTIWREGSKLRDGGCRPLIDPLDQLPFPDRRLVPVHKYIPDPGNYYQLPSTGILFSRGCPFRCAYCSKSVFLNTVRYRSVDNFLDEVDQCMNELGIRDFRLEDEGPTSNPKKMKELCEGLLDRKYRITWHCFSRVDAVDEEQLRLMQRAGCYHITFGVESANQDTLKRLNKRMDLKQAETAVRLTKQADIECKVNFIFGFPWETREDMKHTARFAMKISPDLVSFNLFKPLPGSSLYNEMRQDGSITDSDWANYSMASDSVLFKAAFTSEEIRSITRSAFLWFYLRPRYIIQRLRLLLRHPRRETTTILQGGKILLAILFKHHKQSPPPTGSNEI